MNRRYIIFIFLIINFLILSGCATTSNIVIEPSFEEPTYKIVVPKKSAETLNINVAIQALDIGNSKISDQFAIPEPGKAFATQIDFLKSLVMSIESIIVSKGYHVVKIVSSFESLTEEDKQNIEYLVVPKIKLDAVESSNINSIIPLDLSVERSKTAEIKCEGSITLKGEMIFSILNTKTRDIIFIAKKDISESSNFNVALSKYVSNYTSESIFEELLDRCKEGINGARGKTLEKIYYSYTKTFQKYFPQGNKAKKLFNLK